MASSKEKENHCIDIIIGGCDINQFISLYTHPHFHSLYTTHANTHMTHTQLYSGAVLIFEYFFLFHIPPFDIKRCCFAGVPTELKSIISS